MKQLKKCHLVGNALKNMQYFFIILIEFGRLKKIKTYEPFGGGRDFGFEEASLATLSQCFPIVNREGEAG